MSPAAVYELPRSSVCCRRRGLNIETAKRSRNATKYISEHLHVGATKGETDAVFVDFVDVEVLGEATCLRTTRGEVLYSP